MTEPAGGLSLEMITAALRADSADVALYARVLTESLGDALPAGCVEVDRARSVSDRMRGRPGEVRKITVRLGERLLTLTVQPGRPPAAEICREVRGVVLSRQPAGMQEWVDELARELVAHAQQNSRAAEVLRKLVAGS
jgi:hypothetical protein